MFITIVEANCYLGVDSLYIGQELVLIKEPDNKYDAESIKIKTETGATCGYVANSIDSVARGTHSAGYIYNSIKEKQKCKIEFIVGETAIAELV